MDVQHEQLNHEVQKSPTPPTYDELVQLVAELRAIIREQQETIRLQAESIRLQAEEIKLLKKKLYGSSSEKRKRNSSENSGIEEKASDSAQNSETSKAPLNGNPKSPGNSEKLKRKRILSEQYPNAEVQEEVTGFDFIPMCSCCNEPMIDSGLDEVSEELRKIPEKFIIVRKHRRKFRCKKGFSGLVSAPIVPRIAPGSSLGDSFIMHCALSKFLYLTPAERSAKMVAQSGFDDFSPQLVLAGQHYCADFLRPVYRRLKRGVQLCVILYADETTHRMLEGDDSNRTWYLWGFSGNGESYFEIHNTRSGEVAAKFLAKSQCLFLMSDVYSGYIRAVREANEIRRKEGRPEITMLFCNSHSRRRFTEALVSYPDEAQFFIDQYAEIYRLEAELKLLNNSLDRNLKRAEMRPYFVAMAEAAQKIRRSVPDKSSLAKAIDYFLDNYVELTRFLSDHHLPIDNNLSERQLRCPVVGRKTWLGTHSERGVETTEILFTIFQSCNLSKVNAPQYLSAVIEALLKGDPPFTPQEYYRYTLSLKNAA
jgi:transposase